MIAEVNDNDNEDGWVGGVVLAVSAAFAKPMGVDGDGVGERMTAFVCKHNANTHACAFAFALAHAHAYRICARAHECEGGRQWGRMSRVMYDRA